MFQLKQAYYTSHHQKYPKDFIFDERPILYYELVCFLSGTDCQMTLDGKDYHLKEGDLVFRKPGQINASFMPFESIQLQFIADQDMEGFLDGLEHHYRIHHQSHYQEIFHLIYHETLRGNPFASLLIAGKLHEIIYSLLNEKDHHRNEQIKSSNPELIGMLQYMDRHMQEKFTIEDMAMEVGISRRKVFSLFKSELGTSPIGHLTQLRLNYAANMLHQSNLSIEEIAYRSGFDNHTYFITLFKKHRGQTPAVYRRCKG